MRDMELLALRPHIEHLSYDKALTHEAFQNTTLRAILKYQHPLTRALLDTDPLFAKRFPQSSRLSLEAYAESVDTHVKSHKEIRALIIGMVIGMMTTSEYAEYCLHKAEYNRRIITMQIKRYVDSRPV